MSTLPESTSAPAARDRPRPPAPQSKRAERLAFFAFVVTFIAARTLVLLIITRKIPNLYLHTGGKHVHHLLYGIFLAMVYVATGRQLYTVAGLALFVGGSFLVYRITPHVQERFQVWLDPWKTPHTNGYQIIWPVCAVWQTNTALS